MTQASSRTPGAKGGGTCGRSAPKRQAVKMYSLDALRGLVLLIVVIGHGMVSFGRNTPRGWAANDVYNNPVFDVFGVVTFSFAMQVFFVLAGLFGVLLLQRAGPKGFLVNRYRGIFVPFLVAAVVLVPVLQLIGLYGKSLRAAPGSEDADFWARAGEFFTTSQFWESLTFAHLWFLWYLSIMYVAFVATIPLWKGVIGSAWFKRTITWVMSSRLRAFWLAVPTTILMSQMEYMVDSPIGIWPELDILLYYSLFFAFGVVLFRMPDLFRYCWKSWPSNVAAGFLVCVPLGVLAAVANALAGGRTAGAIRPEALPPAAASLQEALAGIPNAAFLSQQLTTFFYAAFTWSAIFALMGPFQRYFSTPKPVVRYLADASYWMYLVHFPLVLYLQILVQSLEINVFVKFGIVATVMTAILLLSYHFLVRETALGLVLGSSRAKLKKMMAGKPSSTAA